MIKSSFLIPKQPTEALSALPLHQFFSTGMFLGRAAFCWAGLVSGTKRAKKTINVSLGMWNS